MKHIKLIILSIGMFFNLSLITALAGNVPLTWDANPVSDAVTNYTVHWGSVSGQYTESQDFTEIYGDLDLPAGTYYAVVTAYNGLRSQPSNEIVFTIPEAVKGLHIRVTNGKINLIIE